MSVFYIGSYSCTMAANKIHKFINFYDNNKRLNSKWKHYIICRCVYRSFETSEIISIYNLDKTVESIWISYELLYNIIPYI